MISSFASGGENAGGSGGKRQPAIKLTVSSADDDNYIVRKNDLVGLIQQANNRFQFSGRR
jgi:hypothetical protein